MYCFNKRWIWKANFRAGDRNETFLFSHSSYYSRLLKSLLFHPYLERVLALLNPRKGSCKAQHWYKTTKTLRPKQEAVYVHPVSRRGELTHCAGQWPALGSPREKRKLRGLERETGSHQANSTLGNRRR